jgi:hypothetical protein
MATPQSIAARREVALQRICKALEITLKPVKGVSDLRHAAELEQIADQLDPAGRAPASAADGVLREAPFTPHEATIPGDVPGGNEVTADAPPAAPTPPEPTAQARITDGRPERPHRERVQGRR